ncbi:uncharacterized protein LOC113381323 [Ctenocephalides felis]|uniref:uncharacterized protein LOC113381323 n=1 Tax=Ctenocephalides felis TaxID=7515 RepID=UPI000E6E1D26|nr:uncharacterized protein LOC113381323 [Ctenocephalides felis]
MGLIAPVVVKAKMIMQKIWKQKTDWDEEVPATIKEEWKTLQNQFTLLKEIKIQRLLTAKSKVAPIKNVTLPRLELCAALLLARLYKHISKVINIHFDKTFMWSDSTIVLGWLKTDPSKLKCLLATECRRFRKQHPE